LIFIFHSRGLSLHSWQLLCQYSDMWEQGPTGQDPAGTPYDSRCGYAITWSCLDLFSFIHCGLL